MQYLNWLKEHRPQLISAAIILVLLVVTFSLGGSKTPGDDRRDPEASSVEAVSVSSAELTENGEPAILQVPGSGSGSGSGTGPAIAPPAASATAALKEADAEALRTPKPSPTAAAAATAAPAATSTPRPAATEAPAAPSVTDIPEQPAVSEAPEKPETSESPENTEKPEASESPENTGKPEKTEASESPENTEKPEASEKPSPMPEPSTEPSPSPLPSPSQEPEPTESPEPSEEPWQPSCTISISCQTALDNPELCKDGVLENLPGDGCILGTVAVDIQEGDTVFSILQRVCMEYGIAMEYSGGYIEGIGNLYEKDVGELSGWMYCVNGVFPNYGCSGYTVSDGDVICWRYTCDLGWDVGGGW